MKILAEITLDANPENKEQAQHVLNNWTKFNPLEIEVIEVVK
jgi:hypothetical protein